MAARQWTVLLLFDVLCVSQANSLVLMHVLESISSARPQHWVNVSFSLSSYTQFQGCLSDQSFNICQVHYNVTVTPYAVTGITHSEPSNGSQQVYVFNCDNDAGTQSLTCHRTYTNPCTNSTKPKFYRVNKSDCIGFVWESGEFFDSDLAEVEVCDGCLATTTTYTVSSTSTSSVSVFSLTTTAKSTSESQTVSNNNNDNNNNDNNNNNNSGNDNIGMIIGIFFGTIAAILLLIMIAVICVRKTNAERSTKTQSET